MTEQYKPYDLAKVAAKTAESIKIGRVKAHVWDALVQVLKTRQGKRIDKRIATSLKEVLGPEYIVSWEHCYSWHEIRVWTNDALPYDQKFTANIGYDSDPYPAGDKSFDFDHWLERYGGNFGNDRWSEYADRAEVALAEIGPKIRAYNAALEAVRAAHDALEGLAVWDN